MCVCVWGGGGGLQEIMCCFKIGTSSLHTAVAPAVRAAIKTELFYRNDTIITFFVAANKNKDSA